jgi:hypothetical protein
MPTRGHPRVTRVRGAAKFQPGNHSRISARSHLNHRPRCVTLSRTLHDVAASTGLLKLIDDPVNFFNLHGFFPDNLRRK